MGEKEWYFFCKRGRKYKNSIRPNRVTGSGFWKATGIDKAIYSHGGQGNHCIGLKKTLVYYKGNAGKGTKTEWMMHEFRLPNSQSSLSYHHTSIFGTITTNNKVQEAVSKNSILFFFPFLLPYIFPLLTIWFFKIKFIFFQFFMTASVEF